MVVLRSIYTRLVRSKNQGERMILEISHNLTLDSFILMEKHDDIKGLSKLFVVIQNNLF